MGKKRNLIFIISDQLRAESLSCYGDENIRTTNIDRMAGMGARFTSAYASSPVCVPFRFSLFTGMYPHTCNIGSIGDRMSPHEDTIVRQLAAAGYKTANFGKWHLDGITHATPHARDRFLPKKRRGGFEHWCGFDLSNRPFETKYQINDEWPLVMDEYQTDFLFKRATEYLRERKAENDGPFFTVISVEPPHPPYAAPDKYMDMFKDKELIHRRNTPWVSGQPPEHNPVGANKVESNIEEFKARVETELRGYYAQIQNLDDNVGAFMDFMEESGLDEDTVIVFMSDHGDLHGSHGLTRKGKPFEESSGIPLVIVDKRSILAGTVSEKIINSVDIYPTVMSMLGLEFPDTVEGTDKSAKLLDDNTDDDFAYFELVRPSGHWVEGRMSWRSIRCKRHKYSVLPGKPWSLYDLIEDPLEMNNLVDDPARRETLIRMNDLIRRKGEELEDDFVFPEMTDNE